MSSTTLPAAGPASPSARAGMLRRIVAGAAPFDGVTGIACLAAAAPIGDALDVGTTAVEVTGLLFLAAAAVGGWTLRRRVDDVRWLVAANAVFAAWCVAVLAADGPNAVGAALLAVSAVASAATAVVEVRLS